MILVVGATGSLGGRIACGLLAQGKAVRFLDQRNPISLELAQQGLANTTQSLIDARAQPVPGSFRKRVALDVSVKGADSASRRWTIRGQPTIASASIT